MRPAATISARASSESGWASRIGRSPNRSAGSTRLSAPRVLGAATSQVGGGLFVIALAWAFAVWIRYVSSEFAVTDKRVIIKIGLLHRRTLEMLLIKVEAISVDQSIAGRIFGYGTIVVVGTGGTREAFENIASPLEFRRAVQAATT